MSRKKSSVFVVFGRNSQAYAAMTRFLRKAGLKIIPFPTGKGASSVNALVENAHREADAILVLMTPDEITFLRREFCAKADSQAEKGPVRQPRPNVLDELGRSMRDRSNETVLVSMGNVRVPSNLGGIFIQRFEGSEKKRKDVLTALERIGCSIHWDGRWRDRDMFFDAFERAEDQCDPIVERGIPAGVEVQHSYYGFEKLIDRRCRLVIRAGHNFGDHLRDSRRIFADNLITNIKKNRKLKVRLVFVPPEIMKTVHNVGFVDMLKVSIPSLRRLKYHSGLTSPQQKRLDILCHVGALSLSGWMIDPDDTARGLIVVTPRWLTDTHGPRRMFYVVRRSENPELFGALYDQIPSDLDTHPSSETIEHLVERLIKHEVFRSVRGELKPGPMFAEWTADKRHSPHSDNGA